MIKFKNVTKRYANNIAVDNVSFNIKEGEFFVLIGPSGCGKTTTLKMINRLIPLSEGYISVSYTHLTLPTIHGSCRSRWSPYH